MGILIRSVGQYVEEVLRVRASLDPVDPYSEIWFRGVSDGSLDLLPGAYWRKNCEELSLVLSFRSMVPAMLSQEPLDDWEWYFMMQHYGLPTRLLDWSENPLAALYFALESPAAGKTARVWVLDPIALNRASGKEYILVPRGDDWYNVWLPEKCGRGKPPIPVGGDGPPDNSKPLAIFPKRHNPRIVAQRGTFTIHGADEVPLNQMRLSDPAGAPRPIEAIDIDPAARDRLWDELWALGITKAAIYPEPQSLAEDLKRSYKAC